MRTAATENSGTTVVCRLDDLVPERGVAALVGREQVAVFRVEEDGATRLFAVDHYDPFGRANVLARGIVGTAGGRWYVASPLHKQRFDLETGGCLDDPGVSIHTWPVRAVDGDVCVGG